MQEGRIAASTLAVLTAALAASAQPAALRAGAARVDITPAEDAALPMSGYGGRKQGFQKIHDNIYVRALVLESGTARAAIVTWELIGVPTVLWAETSQRIAGELGIPAENLLLAGTHDHGAPALRGGFSEVGASSAAYTEKVQAATLEAVRRAKGRLQPARVGLGTGRAYVNINRRERMPTGAWGLGRNPDGPSDKTVSVLKFEDAAGKPLAIFVNYAVHGVVMGPDNLEITGDLPGATSRFVEQFYAGKRPRSRSDAGFRLRLRQRPEDASADVVALWTSGPAGDQNPIALATGSDFSLVDSLGQILGEEVIRVAAGIKTSPDARIRGAQKWVTCPGGKLSPQEGAPNRFTFQEGPPVEIHLGLLMLGDVALAGVSGEVLTLIHERLKKQSPLKHTIMVTHANGAIGYIPDDAAYEQVSYEITATRLKRGCAEGAIVNGVLELMRGN
jgi:hypothetical protein